MSSQKVVLSSTFNMSLGFMPVILSCILSEFIPINLAIYIGTGIGLLASVLSHYHTKLQIPNFILYISASILAIYSVLTFIPSIHLPAERFSFLLEVSIVIPFLILYIFRNKFIGVYQYNMAQKNRCSLVQGAESTIIAIRVLLIFTTLHIIIIAIAELITWGQLGETGILVLYHVLPPLVFVGSILFNQYGLNYFNRMMSHTRYIAVVDAKGNVIGKVLKVDAYQYKNLYTNVVIRIIPISNGMIFLSERGPRAILEKGKVDTPLETFLNFKESIQEAVNRLMTTKFPSANNLEPTFALKYSIKNQETSRLVYLFLIDITDDSLLYDCTGKLWTLPQIEQNLNMNYFSTCLENEYELLKDIIDTREKYRGS
ncbi:MAG: hypothetical protein LUH22_08150 [Bacteroides sp.]|nr:hypothetical protein [Bacteroides sp.]